MKNLIGMMVFMFAFALSALPVFATACNDCNNDCGDCDNGPAEECCPSVTVSNMNMSKVKGVINTTANSGGNMASWNYGVGKITTGDVGVKSSLTQQVNFNETYVTPTMGSIRVKNMNFGYADGAINTTANTGYNTANGNGSKVVVEPSFCMPKVTKYENGRGEVTTGNVSSTSSMMQLVGSNFTKISK